MKPPEHLARLWVIDCCADGTLSFRRRRQKSFNGRALPVWSVDTATQAERLIKFIGGMRKADPHPRMDPLEPWYTMPHVAESVATHGACVAMAWVTDYLRRSAEHLEICEPAEGASRAWPKPPGSAELESKHA